jgi:hypothetical protein
MIILVIGLATVVIAVLIAVVMNVRFGRDWEPKGDTSSDLAPPPPSVSIRISDEDKTTTTEQ